MRKSIKVSTIFAVPVIASGLVIGPVLMAGQSSADEARTASGTEVINLLAEHNPVTAELDLGDPGFSVGDQTVFSDTMTRNGRAVGQHGGFCQVVSETHFNCLTTMQLPGGQITLQALLDGSVPATAAITGGTGAYSHAHGEMRFEPVNDDTDRVRLTITR